MEVLRALIGPDTGDASLRWGVMARLVKATPVVLVRDGLMDTQAMARHGISRTDLDEGLRMEQVETAADVQLATLEAGGRISGVPKG